MNRWLRLLVLVAAASLLPVGARAAVWSDDAGLHLDRAAVVRSRLSYEFVLRKGARFHNGEAVTAADVKFSFERYRGPSARTLKDHVAAADIGDPLRGAE